uniref:Uncharacterized protein n=1 Tax=Acrobeloides nanus TaxID=290746 RepID=A0A914ENS4_9BILA
MRLNGKDWYVADCPGSQNACTRPHIRGKFTDGAIKDITVHACATRLLNQFLGNPPNHAITYSGCVSMPIRKPKWSSTTSKTIFSTCFCVGDKCNKEPYCKVDEEKMDSCALPHFPRLTNDIEQRVLDLEKLSQMV